MPKEDKQIKMFDIPEWWEEHWQDMPEFKQEDLNAWKSIVVHFEKREDLLKFAELVNQKIYETTKSIWFPAQTLETIMNKRYIDES